MKVHAQDVLTKGAIGGTVTDPAGAAVAGARVVVTGPALVEFDQYLRLEPHGPFAPETRALVEKIKKATSRG